LSLAIKKIYAECITELPREVKENEKGKNIENAYCSVIG
jgi:hypothetical protein